MDQQLNVPFVKICGLQTVKTVEAAVEAGADAVGFVFARSLRQVTVGQSRELSAAASSVLRVGVFSDQPVQDIISTALAAELDAVQLHGTYLESDFAVVAGALPMALIRAVAHTARDLECGRYGERWLIVDAPRGGSGTSWEYDTCRPSGPWLVAGGLTPGTVAAALGASGAWGADVSSGVESRRGVKDTQLIRRFVAAAHASAAAPPVARARTDCAAWASTATPSAVRSAE